MCAQWQRTSGTPLLVRTIVYCFYYSDILSGQDNLIGATKYWQMIIDLHPYLFQVRLFGVSLTCKKLILFFLVCCNNLSASSKLCHLSITSFGPAWCLCINVRQISCWSSFYTSRSRGTCESWAPTRRYHMPSYGTVAYKPSWPKFKTQCYEYNASVPTGNVFSPKEIFKWGIPCLHQLWYVIDVISFIYKSF